MTKRILTILLALCMVLTLMPTVAFAGDDEDTEWNMLSVDEHSDLTLPRTVGENPDKVSSDGKYYYKLNHSKQDLAAGNLIIGGDVVIDLYNNWLDVSSIRINSGTLNIIDNREEIPTEEKSENIGVGLDSGGEISGGTFDCKVNSQGTIMGGTFYQEVNNQSNAKIENGTFNAEVNFENINTVNGGTFKKKIEITGGLTIKNGEFYDEITVRGAGGVTIEEGIFSKNIIVNNGSYDGDGTISISGGTFNGDISGGRYCSITGGTFYGSLPESFSGGYKVNFYFDENDDENDATPYMTKVVSSENANKVGEVYLFENSNTITNNAITATVKWFEKENEKLKSAPFDFDNTSIAAHTNLYAVLELSVPYTIKVTDGSPQKDFALELWNTDFQKLKYDETDVNAVKLYQNTGEDNDYVDGITVSGYTLTTNGSDNSDRLTFTGTLASLEDFFSGNSGLYVLQNPNRADSTKSWEFSDDIWYVGIVQTGNTGGEVIPTALNDDNTDDDGNSIGGCINNLGIYHAKLNPDDSSQYMVDDAYNNEDPSSEMTFTNEYTGSSELIPSGPTHTTRYIVKFDSNGGSAVADKVLYSITGKVIEGVNAPTLEGKQFAGWTYEGAKVEETDTFYGLTKDFSARTITLTAQWTDEEQPVPPTDEENGDKPSGTDENKDMDKPSGNKESTDASASDDGNEVPKTDDENNLPLWTAIILAAGTALAMYRKKNDKNAK